MLGLAITAGVAPLLFLQVLYRRQFYTANLLLFNRFMLLLPALIVAYYMLYLIKSQALAGRGPVLRGLVTSWPGLLLLHSLGVDGESRLEPSSRSLERPLHVGSLDSIRNAEIWPRLGYWITASFPTLAVALAWQLHWGRRLHDPVNLDLAARRLRALAILGLATSAAEAWLWLLWLDPSARGVDPRHPGASLRSAGAGGHRHPGRRLADRSRPGRTSHPPARDSSPPAPS